MNRVRSRDTGYTILETMIFLVISGVLFLLATRLIAGQQNKTEFQAAVRDVDSKIQSIINNVSAGYYKNSGNVSCTVSGGNITSISSTGGQQGSNGDCIYIGERIRLEGSPNNNKFIISSYAMPRINGAIENNAFNRDKAQEIPDSVEVFNFPEPIKATVQIAGGSQIYAFGVFTTFPQTTGGIIKSDSRNYEFHRINLAGNFNPTSLITMGVIEICLTQNAKQWGKIEITNTNSTVKFGTGATCL